MFNKTLFGIGFIGAVAEKFEIAIVAILSLLKLATNLIFAFSFRGLIVELILDCITFGRPVKFWFRKRRRKPPDIASQSKIVAVEPLTLATQSKFVTVPLW